MTEIRCRHGKEEKGVERYKEVDEEHQGINKPARTEESKKESKKRL
jgi:hypothetical protein